MTALAIRRASKVKTFPLAPGYSPRSNNTTESPARAMVIAAETPAGPAPTTMTSKLASEDNGVSSTCR